MQRLSTLEFINTLGNFSVKCLQAKTFKDIAIIVENTLDELIPVENTGLYLYNEDKNKLELLVAKGFTSEEKKLAEDTAMDRHPGEVFRNRIMIHVPDVEKDDHHLTQDSPRSFKVRSRLYIPVISPTGCVGAFGVVSHQKNRFSEEDIAAFKFICDHAGIAYSRIIEENKKKELEAELLLKQRAISASRDGVIITDPAQPDNPIIYVNKAFEDITGYSFEEVKGRNCRFLHGKYSNQTGLDRLREAIKNEQSCLVVLRNVKKDGSEFWTELSITPVFNNNGELANFIGIQNDVTQRVKTEEELRLITSRISQLIQNLPSGILLEDQNRRIALVNDEFRKMFHIDIPIEDLIGSDCSQSAEYSKHLFVNEIGFVKGIEKILSDRRVIKNEELKLKDGRVFERDYIPIIIDDFYSGHLWNYRDITTRKMHEEEISELKHFYEQTLQYLPGEIAVLDTDFHYRYLNPGYVADDNLRNHLIGKTDFDYCNLLGIDQSVARNRLEKLIEVKEKSQTIKFEERINSKDGSGRCFKRIISPVFNHKGEISQFLTYGLDISELKNLVRNLEFSNKSLSEFAYIASHDLREPLRKISAFGSLLKKSLISKLNADEAENLEFMIDGAKRMQNMVDDLLIYSRVTSQPKKFDKVDLDSVFENVIKFNLSESIKEKNAQVIKKNTLGTVRGEETHFHQLLQNIIGNGLKYSRKDTPPIIIVSSTDEQDDIILRIEDNGIGIPAIYHDQIFEMFKRLHSKDEYSGNGIGLAVCKRIVENYSGKIVVESEVGKGSAFIITLPRGMA